MTEPDGGRFTYSYDPVGRIESVLNPTDNLVTFAYDAAGQMVRTEKPITWMSTHTYDAAGRLVRIFNGSSINLGFANNAIFTYTYDNVGNRATVLEKNLERVTWTYDKTYQLTGEVRSGANAYDLTHDYDPVGNRLQEIDNSSGEITTSAYDSANQLETSQDSGGTTNKSRIQPARRSSSGTAKTTCRNWTARMRGAMGRKRFTEEQIAFALR